jgi:hypothetical protein
MISPKRAARLRVWGVTLSNQMCLTTLQHWAHFYHHLERRTHIGNALVARAWQEKRRSFFPRTTSQIFAVMDAIKAHFYPPPC